MAINTISPAWLKNAVLDIYDGGTPAASTNAGNDVLGILNLSGTNNAWPAAHYYSMGAPVCVEYSKALWTVAVATAQRITLSFPYNVVAAIRLTCQVRANTTYTDPLRVVIRDIVSTAYNVTEVVSVTGNGTTGVDLQLTGVYTLRKNAQLQIWGAIVDAAKTITIVQPRLHIVPLALVLDT